MKKNWFNQSGGALVLVLITITVIGILVPILMSNILSSASQYQKTEESFQRAKLEEMAELYFEKTVKQVSYSINSQENSPENTVEFLAELDDVLSNYFSVVLTGLEDGNQNFELQGIDIDENEEISYSIVTIIDGDLGDGPKTKKRNLNEFINIVVE